jgi:hypothetical protein
MKIIKIKNKNGEISKHYCKKMGVRFGAKTFPNDRWQVVYEPVRVGTGYEGTGWRVEWVI